MADSLLLIDHGVLQAQFKRKLLFMNHSALFLIVKSRIVGQIAGVVVDGEDLDLLLI